MTKQEDRMSFGPEDYLWMAVWVLYYPPAYICYVRKINPFSVYATIFQVSVTYTNKKS